MAVGRLAILSRLEFKSGDGSRAGADRIRLSDGRRRAAEGASYGAIVDDVRRKLAIEYLQTTQMSVDDVAWKVGFSDSTNLRRAIRRWTNKTVNEIRANK